MYGHIEWGREAFKIGISNLCPEPFLRGVESTECTEKRAFRQRLYLTNSQTALPRGFGFTSPFASDERSDKNVQGRNCIFAVLGEAK